MKKYNLSNIMKRAWELVKKVGLSMSEALKEAWKEAKTVKEKFNKIARIKKTGTQWSEESSILTFKAWEKYGKKRVYINDYKNRTIGYIEGESHKIIDCVGNTMETIEAAIADFRMKYEF